MKIGIGIVSKKQRAAFKIIIGKTLLIPQIKKIYLAA